jgi:DNA primase
MTVHDLMKADGIQLKRVASTNGGEFAGPCPRCGGTDRFICWPCNGKTGRFWCRGCGINGDAIQYLRDFRDMSFRQACQTLGLETKLKSNLSSIQDIKLINAPWEPKEAEEPNNLWKQKAKDFIEASTKSLEGNTKTMEYLYGRGLNKETIKQTRLGWNPSTIYCSRSSWGLPERFNEKGENVKHWIPDGHVIPFFYNDKPLKLKVRIGKRAKTAQPYCQVAGSMNTPMLLGCEAPVVIVESELDALLINQETESLVSVAATGSAKIKPDLESYSIFKSAPLILVSLDTNDKAGYEGWLWWKEHFTQAKRWPVIKGKDPGEAWKNGLDIRNWIEAGLDNLKTDTKALVSSKDTVSTQTRHHEKDIIPEQCHGCWAHYENGYCCKEVQVVPCSKAFSFCFF